MYSNVYGNSSKYPLDMETLEGTELSIVAMDDKDYAERMRFQIYKNGSIAFVGGMCFELLLVLQQALKFNYKPLRATHWTGLVEMTVTGDVINGAADIAISQAAMVMLQQPLGYISYLLPTSASRLTAIFRQPPATRDLLTTALEFDAWIGFLITWVSIFITLKVLLYFIKWCKILVSDYKGLQRVIRKKLDVILWCIATVTNQGWHEERKEQLIRVTFFVALAFNIVFGNIFSASLTSILATEKRLIKSFNDLASSNVKVYADTRLPIARILATDIYLNKRSELGVQNFEPYFIYVNMSMKRIVSETAAFITLDEATGRIYRPQGLSEQYFCTEIDTLHATKWVIQNAMFVKKGSRLKEIFNRKIGVIYERGLTFRINARYKKRTFTTCPVISQKYRGGLSIVDVSTAFLVIILGFGFSSVVIMWEQYWRKYTVKPDRSNGGCF